MKQTIIMKHTSLDVTVIIDEGGGMKVYNGDILIKNLLHSTTINLNTFTIDKLFKEINFLKSVKL